MFNLRLLIVEDEETQLNTYSMKIDLFNASNHGFYIDKTEVESLEKAKQAIALRDFDAAIIDLRLKVDQGNNPNDDGNEVLNIVLENELAVVAIFSAETTIAKIPNEYSTIVKIFTKGEENATDNVLSWINSHSDLIKCIKNSQMQIKKEMAKLFNKSIWPRWNNWITNSDEKLFINHSLTRHLTAHIYASFLERTENKVHAEEWYFIPPIRSAIRTGDLIKNDNGSFEIIITPRCDLARNGKNETYQLVECKTVSEKWKELNENLEQKKLDLQSTTNGNINSKQEKVNKAQEEIRKFTQHYHNSSIYHFLPQINNINGENYGPFLVQFDKLRSIKRTEDNIEDILITSRVATISPEFLPSLIERLGAFFSRFGTPDYSHHD